MLILEGWINGISAAISFVIACVFGLGIIYQARKLKANLLFYMGLNIFLASLFWLVPSLDFLNILFTGNNLANPYHWMGIVNFMWAPFVTLISMYIGAKLMIPEKLYYIVFLYFILSIIFELVIFLNPIDSFYFTYPENPGEDLIYIFTNSGSLLVTLLYIIFSISGIFFCGFGYLIKGFQTKRIIRKKFFLLSLGYFLFLGVPLLRFLVLNIEIYIPIFFVRIGMVSSFLFFYSGLKEEPTEPKMIKSEKEVNIEESIFRITRRPDKITDEEVVFHKEKKICLVCKGKVGGFNTYICTGCDALYCKNCARSLSTMENACWVCNKPFDDEKPSKPFKIEEEELDIDVLENEQNKVNNKKTSSKIK